jgi:hypothetical protein
LVDRLGESACARVLCAPLLCAPASAKGITDLGTPIGHLRERGLPTERIWVAAVEIAGPDTPRRVQAGRRDCSS